MTNDVKLGQTPTNFTEWRREQGMMAQVDEENLVRLGHLQADEAVDEYLRQHPPPVWSVSAKVAKEQPFGPGGKETRRGTKHFAPGARVYCLPSQWHDGYYDIIVVGFHRGGRQYVSVVMPSERLTGWRVELVYRPAIVKAMIRGAARHFWRERPSLEQMETLVGAKRMWDGAQDSRDLAERIVSVMQEREAAKMARGAPDSSTT